MRSTVMFRLLVLSGSLVSKLNLKVLKYFSSLAIMVPNVLIINLAIVMHISNVTVYNYAGYLLKLPVI